MRRLFLMAAVTALLAGCRDSAKEAEDRADRAIALVAELQQKVADLETEVADLDDQVGDADPGVDGSDDGPGYVAASSPARALWIKSRVRSTPKIATKEPKRGPWL